MNELVRTVSVKKTLYELAAAKVGQHVCCSTLQKTNPPLDEKTLRVVAYNAFPRDEEHVRVISELSDNRPEYWNGGKHLFKDGYVKRIKQIGFLLAAVVEDNCHGKSASVTVAFEKQRITSTHCSLCNYLWCTHIVAAIVYRIRKPSKVLHHSPLTDALLPLTKEQLQQLLQFTITRNPGQLLCHVFEDLDKVRNRSESINLTQGYPDPTFGLHSDEESTDQLSIKRIGRLPFFQDRDLPSNGNKTCCSLTDQDAFMSSRYLSRKEKCMKTAIELLRKGDINLSGEVFIQLAHYFFRVQDQLNTSERIFMLNIERWFSLFIASCKGPIREKMLSVALKYNRNFVEKNYTPHEGEMTMRSIKLKKDRTDYNDNVINNVMGENRFGPFYEAILAHFQNSIPEALQLLYDKFTDNSLHLFETHMKNLWT
ncbi:zinc finger SWIM domain-containing protein 8 homolog [Mytilus trossulus]|uniref:zinc finger SWIM domain-containing protein 8 homolog n=1 Tax=Mytilus trossulus TaxID=6551 RepID=UPI003006E39C